MKHSKLFIFAIMTTLAVSGCKHQAATYPTDTLTTKNGSQLTITFFKHASLAIETEGRHIYIDPISQYADYASLPKADLILITHSHYDHLDSAAVAALSTAATTVVCDRTSSETLGGKCLTMKPGDTLAPRDYLSIEAVPAYNTSEDRQQFHPREREDCGNVLTIGGTRIYIAGDGENTPEMKALHGIDIAFLPVYLPYTMTVDQAVDAVKAIRPAIFYPYHYGEGEEKTDIDRLSRELTDITEIRIRPMEKRFFPTRSVFPSHKTEVRRHISQKAAHPKRCPAVFLRFGRSAIRTPAPRYVQTDSTPLPHGTHRHFPPEHRDSLSKYPQTPVYPAEEAPQPDNKHPSMPDTHKKPDLRSWSSLQE